MQPERFQRELLAKTIDCPTKLAQIFDNRRYLSPCPTILVVIEQAPGTGCGDLKGRDQRLQIFRFQLTPPSVQTFETISFRHGRKS